MIQGNDVADVCIIGAGLAGGVMAYELASRGLKVVVLEAGPRHSPEARVDAMRELLESGKDPWAPELPERDVYTNDGEIAYPLERARVKAVGGSTLRWGGLALRFHETDFQMKSLYGLAEDWPIRYADLEPFYGKAELALGVAGTADNPFAPYRTTNYPLPGFPYNYDDRHFQNACNKLGILMHHVPWARNSIPFQDGPACMAFATCGNYGICPISAQYTSERHIRLAEKTGNASVIPNANVRRIQTDKLRRVNHVVYATPDKTQHEQSARTFVLCAHAIESARLLLLSASAQFPQGLANGSGMVGKNFMDHLYFAVDARLKEPVFPHRIGFHTAESHQFIPTGKRDETGTIKLEFEVTGPTPADVARRSGLWGKALAEEIRQSFGHHLRISLETEQLPDERNTITLDPHIKDHFGDAAPRITYSLGEYERDTAVKGIAMGERIFDAMGVEEITRGGRDSIERMNFGKHHMGTCRMGIDPATSVVNPDLRAHEVENLFVVGSSVFVTGGSVQPSLTIAALAIRAAEFIAQQEY